MTAPDLRSLVTWRLSQANLRAHRILSDRLGALGASGYQFRVLAALGEHAPLSQVALGALAVLDRRDVTVTLAELEADGLVERGPDPEDGRRNVVTATERGTARLEVLAAAVQAVQDEVLAPLDDAQRRALLDALEALQPVQVARLDDATAES